MTRAFIVSLTGAVLIEHVKHRVESLRQEVGAAKLRQAAFKRRMAQHRMHGLPGAGIARGHLRPVPGGSVRDVTPGFPELVQGELGKIIDQKAEDLAEGMVLGNELAGDFDPPDPLAPRIAEAERAIADWTFMLDRVLDPAATYQLTWEDLHDFGLFAVPVEDMPIVYGGGVRPGIR